MGSLAVVKHFDVFGHGHARPWPGGEDVLVVHFVFEAGKKCLGHGIIPAHCETWKWLVWDWLAGWVLALQYRLFVTHQHTDIQGIVIPANCPFNRYWLAGTVPVHLGNLIRRLSAEKRRRDSSLMVLAGPRPAGKIDTTPMM